MNSSMLPASNFEVGGEGSNFLLCNIRRDCSLLQFYVPQNYITTHRNINPHLLHHYSFLQQLNYPSIKMGTRNLILVYYKGQYRIVQYGQWDGYPAGQGLTILNFILDPTNIQKLEGVLDNSDNRIIVLSDTERDAYFEDLHRKQIETRSSMPIPAIESLSRDTGAKILSILANATQLEPVKIHLWSIDFLADNISMEWAWVVDLDKKVLEAFTHWDRYKIVDERSRFEEVLGSGKKLPGLVKRFGFDELPKDKLIFLGKFEESLVDEADRW